MKVKFAYITYLVVIISLALIVNRGHANMPATSTINVPANSKMQGINANKTFLKAQTIKHNFISSKTDSTGASWLDYRIVAHALGSLEGHRATNSVEAMAVNYTDNKMRLFEADLILTSDDKLVARHDWLPYLYDLLGQTGTTVNKSKPLSYREFKSLYSFGKYEPMDFETLVSLLQQHKDMYVITDTKNTEPEVVVKQFQVLVNTVKKVDVSILDRLIIQIYNQEMYDLVKSIYPFKNIIYAIYANSDSQSEVLEFCKDKGIKVVAVPVEKMNPKFAELLAQNEIKVYVHTVNTEQKKDLYKNMGVWGIYSDHLTGTW